MEIRGSTSNGPLTPEVSEFVENIFNENSSKLNAMLSVSLSNVSPSTLDEAESILIHIHQLLLRTQSGEITEEYFGNNLLFPNFLDKKVVELSDNFFDLVPCRSFPDETISNIQTLSDKQELIQMIKDTNQVLFVVD